MIPGAAVVARSDPNIDRPGALRVDLSTGVVAAIADPKARLERREDPVGAVHVTADQVLQLVVAVQAAASLPELH